MSTDNEHISSKRLAIAGLLAWLLPGLGHLYLGRRFKGIAYFVIINGLFLSGWAMSKGEAMSLYEEDGHRYAFLAEVGAGGPTIASLAYTHWEDLENRWQQDWLLESMRSRLKATDDPDYVASLPWIDAGLLYCMVAGLLNLLIVYEAATGGRGIVASADQAGEAHEPEAAAASPPAAEQTGAETESTSPPETQAEPTAGSEAQ